MNTKEIAEKVATDHGFTKTQAKTIVDQVFDSVVAAMLAGDKVNVAGLGVFQVRDRPARKARNPRTGESVDVAASRKIAFRPAKGLKASLAA